MSTRLPAPRFESAEAFAARDAADAARIARLRLAMSSTLAAMRRQIAIIEAEAARIRSLRGISQ